MLLRKQLGVDFQSYDDFVVHDRWERISPKWRGQWNVCGESIAHARAQRQFDAGARTCLRLLGAPHSAYPLFFSVIPAKAGTQGWTGDLAERHAVI